MAHHGKATNGHTAGRQRAEQFLSGTMPSVAPSPLSVGFNRTKLQRTLHPHLSPPSNTHHTTSSRVSGINIDQQERQIQDRPACPPALIVIDDSDEENQNGEPLFSREAGQNFETLDDLQSQQSIERHRQARDVEEAQEFQPKRESSPAYGASDSDEDQQNSEGQRAQFQDSQHQTRALIDLPEVNIPRSERVETPRAMVCELLAHQRVGLTWLIRQEEDPNKRGSILADGMGLGKTIEALGLIVSRRFDPADPFCRTTLIVAPLALLPQWQDEILKKVTLRQGRKLSAIIFHGSGTRDLTTQHLLQYDIVLCTYGKLVSEYKMYTEGPRYKCKLLSSEATFYRVILDEAHFIKNKNTQSSKAVCQLQAVHRLCMTGTPLMNNVTELYPLIRFLAIKPYSVWEKFSEDIDRPIRGWKLGMETPAMLDLQTLMKSLMLRRNKDSRLENERIIDLEERVDIELYIKFGSEQQAFYNALQLREKLKFNKFLKAGTVMKNYMQILTWLLRLRQACDHPYLVQNHCIPDTCNFDAEDMINLALQLPAHARDSLKAIRRFRCPKCTDFNKSMTKNPVIISPCGHYICAECYSMLMEEGIHQHRGPANMHGKEGSCPNRGCHSVITPDNILMHNFFVDALKGAGIEIELSDDDEESSDDGNWPSDDEDESMELQSEGSGVDTDRSASQSDLTGLFVDPHPNEPDVYGRGDSRPPGGAYETSVSDEKPQKTMVEDQADIRQSNPLLFAETSARWDKQPSPSAPSGGGSRSRIIDTTPMLQNVGGKLDGNPGKGEYGNPVNIDDEEEEAAFYAVSRQIASAGGQHRIRRVKIEAVEADKPQEFGISNYDGPGSPIPRLKRKSYANECSDRESKRAWSGHRGSNLSGLSSHMSSNGRYMDSDEEEGIFSPGRAYPMNRGDFHHVKARRATTSFGSRGNANVLHNGQQFQSRYPKVEEDEDTKPEVHRLGQRAREVLQRSFVSLSNKRQIADQSKRAMVAYQKRVASEWVASAKTEKIMDLLKMIRRDRGGEKTLIFSLWTVFLDMLEPPLREGGFKYTVYTGGMKTDNRTAAVQTFMTNPELDVMLISLSAGSCGLNLTAANHVILAEPFWNPYVEEQAIDRTHRLGQQKKVFVYRILIKGTIEKYIVRLQKRKKDLVSAALCDAETDSPLNKLTVEELRELFGV